MSAQILKLEGGQRVKWRSSEGYYSGMVIQRIIRK